MLEKWQHEALRARAERGGQSLSGLVREALDRYLAPGEGGGMLASIEGIGTDTAVHGRTHDEALYPAGRATRAPARKPRS
jgi:hypothetical protein